MNALPLSGNRKDDGPWNICAVFFPSAKPVITGTSVTAGSHPEMQFFRRPCSQSGQSPPTMIIMVFPVCGWHSGSVDSGFITCLCTCQPGGDCDSYGVFESGWCSCWSCSEKHRFGIHCRVWNIESIWAEIWSLYLPIWWEIILVNLKNVLQ